MIEDILLRLIATLAFAVAALLTVPELLLRGFGLLMYRPRLWRLQKTAAYCDFMACISGAVATLLLLMWAVMVLWR